MPNGYLNVQTDIFIWIIVLWCTGSDVFHVSGISSSMCWELRDEQLGKQRWAVIKQSATCKKQGKVPGKKMSRLWPHCQISILYVGSELQEYQHQLYLLFTFCSKYTKQILCQSILFCQKLPFTVNCLAAVALIHKLVKMTVHFCFHDTGSAATDTKLHIGLCMFGKCKPQISRVLWFACKTIAQGKWRKNKQKRGV